MGRSGLPTIPPNQVVSHAPATLHKDKDTHRSDIQKRHQAFIDRESAVESFKPQRVNRISVKKALYMLDNQVLLHGQCYGMFRIQTTTSEHKPKMQRRGGNMRGGNAQHVGAMRYKQRAVRRLGRYVGQHARQLAAGCGATCRCALRVPHVGNMQGHSEQTCGGGHVCVAARGATCETAVTRMQHQGLSISGPCGLYCLLLFFYYFDRLNL
jgi:hypothetical protein